MALATHKLAALALASGLTAATAMAAWAIFTPAAQAQTQATSATAVSANTQVLAEDLEHPWALAFLPGDGGMLITERPGRLRHWSAQSGLSAPIRGLPELFAQGQGGLLDVAPHPDFERNRLVYLTFSRGEARNPTQAPAGTELAVARLSDDLDSLEDLRIIFQQLPKRSSGAHFGSKLVFDGQGHLYVTLGENNQRPTAQELSALQGKIVRLRDSDGAAAQGNPFAGQEGKRPEIWSYGHRNPQGAAFNPWTKELWAHEHGPRGGDEINIVRAGANYGWPLATYGINYSGLPIPEALGEQAPGTEPPHYYWPVSPAISGMAFYDHERYPQWRRSLFVGALKEQLLIRLQLAEDGRGIESEERLLQDLGARIREVRVGPDGYVYVLTDARDGKLIRVEPGA